LSLRGTRTQYSKNSENEFHGDPDNSPIKRKPRAWLIAAFRRAGFDELEACFESKQS
jgi:hypothetical protein